MRHVHGGIAEWKEAGLPIESAPVEATANDAALGLESRVAAVRGTSAQRGIFREAVFDLVDRLSTTHLFAAWMLLILACAASYWLLSYAGLSALTEKGKSVAADTGGLWTAIYFSFITALSVGYGDILPMGAARILAVAEAAGGLLIFGLLIAKFVSHRQDLLVRQIHAVTFEERLDRVQTNLHLVVSELLAIAAACADGSGQPRRCGPRLESTVLIFVGELRVIHHLLYEPEQTLDESVLSALLANLSSALNMMGEVMQELPRNFPRSSALNDALRTVSVLAQDICAECVPQVYADGLKILMDRIQQSARTIALHQE